MDPFSTTLLSSLLSSGISAGTNYLMNSGNNSGQTGMPNYSNGGIRAMQLPNTNRAQMLQVPNQTEEGRNVLNKLLQQGIAGLQNQGRPDFGPIKEAYEQNYRQNVMPSIAERFASLGGGAAGSSGFKASMLGAEGNLQQQLAGMEKQYNQQDFMNLLNMLSMGLQPQYEYMYQPREKSLWESLLAPLLGGVSNAAGTMGSMYAYNKWGQPTTTSEGGK